MMSAPEDLPLACRILGTNGHHDVVFGHASVRADGAAFWLKGGGIGLEETGPDDLVLLDRDGTVREGTRPRHNEYPIHAEVYAARPDVGAVVHTHPPFSVVVGAQESPLRPIGHEGAFFAPHGVPVFTTTSDLIVTRELGAAVAAALGAASAVLLRNHGIVTVGTDVREATIAALLLEKACYVQTLMHPGSDYAWSTAPDAEAKRARMYSPASLLNMWHYYVRRLPGGDGGTIG